jgi:hypothetical protein
VLNFAFITWWGSYLKPPFRSYRFQGQSLYKIRPARFRGAIEEAFLAERSFFDLQMDVGCSLQDSVSDQSVPDGIQEGVASNNVLECQSKAQVTGLVKFYKS